MRVSKLIPVTAGLWLSVLAVMAQPTEDRSGTAPAAPPQDLRQVVNMPDEARAYLRADMLDHLAALAEILGSLAASDLETAARTAEQRLGESTMGRYRGNPMAPGRHMPAQMHAIGQGMHAAASEFSRTAAQGDMPGAYGALQKLAGYCTACHFIYRVE